MKNPAELREKYAIIKFLVNAQKTAWYPILYGLLCFIGGIHDRRVYIPIMWVLISMLLFSVLFADDNKVFLPPLCMTYFALGKDTPADSFYTSSGDMLSYMHEDALKHIIAMLIIGVVSLAVRLILDGSIASVFKKRRRFTWGILAMDAAFLLNGIFSPAYDIKNLGYGALLAMGFTVVYFLVTGMLDKSQDTVKYACYVMVFLAYSALLQIMIVVAKLVSENQYIVDLWGETVINRSFITLGWGVSNVITGIFILGIPAAMYLARNERASVFFFLSCPIFILGTVIVNTRSAMSVGIATFIVCAVLCCVSGKNKSAIRICTSVFLPTACIAALFFVFSKIPLDMILHYLRLDPSNDSGRFLLWKNGIEDFMSNPIFGAGLADGAYLPTDPRFNNLYSNMYHCILVQFPAAMGIIGCIAFLIHIAELAYVALKRPSINIFLILCLPLMIILMSLFDNFFFYLQFQIIYVVFCVISEKYASEKDTLSADIL